MTSLTLDLITPTELRLGARLLQQLADEREGSLAYDAETERFLKSEGEPKVSLGDALKDVAHLIPDAEPDDASMTAGAALMSSDEAVDAANAAADAAEPAKRRRRTKAEMDAARAAAEIVSIDSLEINGGTESAPQIHLYDSAGDRKASLDTPAEAAEALIAIFAAAPSLASLDNILAVNANALSAVGKKYSDDVIVAYGARQAELKAEVAPRTGPKAEPEKVQAPSEFIVTRIDGKTAGFTKAEMAADCLVKVLDTLTNDACVTAFSKLNAPLLSKIDPDGKGVSQKFQEKMKSFEALFAEQSHNPDNDAPIDNADDMPKDPEVLKAAVRDLLVAYIKRPDIGFTKGTEFMKTHAKADRFTKIDAALYPALYRLVKPLVAA